MNARSSSSTEKLEEEDDEEDEEEDDDFFFFFVGLFLDLSISSRFLVLSSSFIFYFRGSFSYFFASIVCFSPDF